MRCKGCQTEAEEGDFGPHCGGGCRWAVCPHCRATFDTASADPEAFFAKRPKAPDQAG